MIKRETIAFLYGAIAVLLLLCLLHMPYGFYAFVRFVATVAFCFFAFDANQHGNRDRMILFIILAILFQPFLKIPLGRVIWNIVDIVIAGYLLYLMYTIIKK